MSPNPHLDLDWYAAQVELCRPAAVACAISRMPTMFARTEAIERYREWNGALVEALSSLPMFLIGSGDEYRRNVLVEDLWRASWCMMGYGWGLCDGVELYNRS